MSEELKPCPFCGGESRVATHPAPFKERGEKVFRVECIELPCKVHPVTLHQDTEVEAIAAWNNRPDIQRETSEACAEIVRVCGEIQTSPEAKAACLEISALLKELGKAKTAEELLANLAKGGE